MILLTRVLCAILQFEFILFGCGFGIKQTHFHRKLGHHLPNGVVTAKYVESELECSMHCVRLESCLSVNYKFFGVNKGLCELHNNTITEKQQGHENNHFVYLGKAVWSQGKTEMQEIVSRPSCNELLNDDSNYQNGVYNLQSNDSSQRYPVYCHMNDIPGCGGGGWTLVMKTSGNASTFSYHSPFWKNMESYAVEDGLEGLTETESKLASYWNTPFKKICLGMAVNGERGWMALEYEATSLYSVIADGQYRNTSAGRQAWKSLIAGSSLQPYCNQEGFNNAYQQFKIRIGYYTNNQNSCNMADSGIGFGISYKSCYITSNITCGNIAQCSHVDNGKKLTAAFGYILVQ